MAEFEETYGPNGAWVALFHPAKGYLRTELHKRRGKPYCYITIDRWDSLHAWEDFRATHAADFDAIDARCEDFTIAEREIGRYEPAS